MNSTLKADRIIGLGTLFFLGGMASNFIYKVHPGERAIVFNKFGKGVSNQVYKEGYHLRIPLIQEIIKYDIKIQPFDYFSFTATKDMQKVQIKIKIFYKLTHQTIGTSDSKNPFGTQQRLRQQNTSSHRQRSPENNHCTI